MTGDPYRCEGCLYSPPCRVEHQEEHYDSAGFDVLREMQETHFWYGGRHRFLLQAVENALGACPTPLRPWRVIDLGGGCGGWIHYLLAAGGRARLALGEIALGDSSPAALAHAGACLPGIDLYRLDLRCLGWEDRWDIAFLLDVLEHLPDDQAVLSEIHAALAPGGLLFVTVPALDLFWTWNDDAGGHLRRYSKADLVRLADATGFGLVDCRYFMFLLSPLLLAFRWLLHPAAALRPAKRRRSFLRRLHGTPPAFANRLLERVFAWETPLGHRLYFPWGSSLLAVLEKRSEAPATSHAHPRAGSR